MLAAEETGMKVAYSATIDSLHAAAHDPNHPRSAPAPSSTYSPWNHHVDSPAAIEAVKAVRRIQCDRGAESPYEKLLDLAHALQTGSDRG